MPFVNCFGNNPGNDEPVLDDPKTIEDLLVRFDGASENTVWRGQAYWMWPAIPTLYRRLRKSGLADFQINDCAISRAEGFVVTDARKKGVLAENDSILEFMACVQHHGGATRLLDVTTDYRVALFFACSGHPDMCGTVLSYRVNPCNRIDLAQQQDSKTPEWADLLRLCDDGCPRLVMPAAYDQRIKVQCGAFLLLKLQGTLAEPNPFTNQSYDAEVKSIRISPELKREVLAYLAGMGITENALFPGIEYFARSHSVDDPIYLA